MMNISIERNNELSIADNNNTFQILIPTVSNQRKIQIQQDEDDVSCQGRSVLSMICSCSTPIDTQQNGVDGQKYGRYQHKYDVNQGCDAPGFGATFGVGC